MKVQLQMLTDLVHTVNEQCHLGIKKVTLISTICKVFNSGHHTKVMLNKKSSPTTQNISNSSHDHCLGPALRIGKPGSCLGSPSKRDPQDSITEKQNLNGTELHKYVVYATKLFFLILLLILSYSNGCLFLN